MGKLSNIDCENICKDYKLGMNYNQLSKKYDICTWSIGNSLIKGGVKSRIRKHKCNENYFEKTHKYSSSLDILASYLKGQKLIYMESKAYCENQLNYLMMPSILLSTAATVLASIVKDLYWGAYMIAGVNGLISFLLALVNYFKLDAASEAHKISAHQYDKLQTSIEFLSGKTLLFNTSINSKKDMTNDILMKHNVDM